MFVIMYVHLTCTCIFILLIFFFECKCEYGPIRYPESPQMSHFTQGDGRDYPRAREFERYRDNYNDKGLDYRPVPNPQFTEQQVRMSPQVPQYEARNSQRLPEYQGRMSAKFPEYGGRALNQLPEYREGMSPNFPEYQERAVWRGDYYFNSRDFIDWMLAMDNEIFVTIVNRKTYKDPVRVLHLLELFEKNMKYVYSNFMHGDQNNGIDFINMYWDYGGPRIMKASMLQRSDSFIFIPRWTGDECSFLSYRLTAIDSLWYELMFQFFLRYKFNTDCQSENLDIKVEDKMSNNYQNPTYSYRI